MKRFLLFITAIIFSIVISNGQQSSFAPLNPDYEKYLELKNSSLKTGTDISNFGYIPIPIQLNFSNTSASKTDPKKSTLPSSYDLSSFGLVTSVKDQSGGDSTNSKNGGNCWAFATMGALESNWLKKGLGTYDLSEQHLAACHGFEWGYGDGGNELLSLAYLTRLSGPIYESENSYTTHDDSISCVEGLSPFTYVTEAVWLPNDADIIKQALIDHGAISISMTYDGASFNSSNNTFYYAGLSPVNHAVLLTGWDDNKVTDGGIGAWKCKNQWDSDWAENGFFYISYNDTRVLTSAAYFPTKLALNKIDTLFMYDTLGPNGAIGMASNTAYGLTKFTASEQTFINKIGSFLSTENSVIDIEIYDNFDGKALSNKLASIENKIVRFPGYYTFDISAVVDSGDFYVKMKYTTPGYNYPVPVEREDDADGAPFARPSIEKGKNWISLSGNYWSSIGSDKKGEEYDLCIRAYGMTNPPVSSFKYDREYVCQNGGSVTFTDGSFGNLDSIVWSFGDGASLSTITDTLFTDTTNNSHTITYSTSGNKTITLIAYGNSSSDTLTKEDLIIVGDSINVNIPISETETVTGKPFTLSAYGADDYEWKNKNDQVSIESSFSHSESFEGISEYTVTGTQGNCTGSDTVTVYIWKNPENDDVCDAILLDYGESISYTNKHATVEDNEPSPPEDGCVAPNSWCVEGGLQHSVWFKFKATETEIVSIEASGIDCQIAVYKAQSCDSILQDNYTMLAANDDIGLITKDSRIDGILNLEKDSIYWLQLDGSFGGDTGTFKITLSKWYYGIDDIESHKSELLVFPNPNTGTFNVQFNSIQSQNILLNIYNINGQLVYSEAHKNIQGIFNNEIHLDDASNGMYFIHVIGDKQTLRSSTIIQ